MALPPWAAAEEGLGWPRGDCSLRWAMRPAIEVGVVGAGVAGVPPAVTWLGVGFGFGFGLGFGVGLGVERAGPPRRATRPSYPNPNPILTLTLTLRPTASRVHDAREAVWYEVGWSGRVPKGAPPMPRTLCPLRSI